MLRRFLNVGISFLYVVSCSRYGLGGVHGDCDTQRNDYKRHVSRLSVRHYLSFEFSRSVNFCLSAHLVYPRFATDVRRDRFVNFVSGFLTYSLRAINPGRKKEKSSRGFTHSSNVRTSMY